jgi:transposase
MLREARVLNALIADCRAGCGPEVRGIARTLIQWREAILAWHTTGYTNGPVEGLNSLIKKIFKRVAAGFRTSPTTGSASCSWSAAATGTYSEPHTAETRSAG